MTLQKTALSMFLVLSSLAQGLPAIFGWASIPDFLAILEEWCFVSLAAHPGCDVRR